jgi:hypothetical protein
MLGPLFVICGIGFGGGGGSGEDVWWGAARRVGANLAGKERRVWEPGVVLVDRRTANGFITFWGDPRYDIFG